jgi:hypothetical protein
VRALVVKEPEIVMHEGDEPGALAGPFDSDGLASEGFAWVIINGNSRCLSLFLAATALVVSLD